MNRLKVAVPTWTAEAPEKQPARRPSNLGQDPQNSKRDPATSTYSTETCKHPGRPIPTQQYDQVQYGGLPVRRNTLLCIGFRQPITPATPLTPSNIYRWMYYPLSQRFSSRRSSMSKCPAMMHQMNRLGVARRVDDRDGLSPRGRPVAPLPRRGTDAAGAPLASWSATRPKIKQGPFRSVGAYPQGVPPGLRRDRSSHRRPRRPVTDVGGRHYDRCHAHGVCAVRENP